MITTLLARFAAETGPSVHIVPTEVFTFHGLPISNSILYGWISSFIIIVLSIAVARMVRIKPRGRYCAAL